MSFIPGRILSKLFNRTSLKNCGNKVCFSVKNRLAPATLLSVSRIEIDGAEIPIKSVNVSWSDGSSIALTGISPKKNLDFPLGALLYIVMETEPLEPGKHDLQVVVTTEHFGELSIKVSEELKTGDHAPGSLPRDP